MNIIFIIILSFVVSSLECKAFIKNIFENKSANINKIQSFLKNKQSMVVNANSLTRWPSIKSSQGLLRLFDWIGTISFAASGCISAGNVGMDLLGCYIVGCITALGGGTIFDCLIGKKPVFWVHEWEYLILCLTTSSLTFSKYKNKNLSKASLLLRLTDTIGLGTFSVIGTQSAMNLKLHPIICLLSGIGTASFGGIIRDVLCKQEVRILYSNRELYASSAFVGSLSYLILSKLNVLNFVRIFLSIILSIISRNLAIKNNLILPTASWYKLNHLDESKK